MVFCIIGIFCGCASEVPSNEKPMYGNVPFTERQQKLNEQFIQNVILEAGGKEVGSERAIKLAWQYCYSGDPKTGMKRFNQAWLLNPNNAEAYYGYAVFASVQSKRGEGISFYKRVLELNPNHSMALANLARSYIDKAQAFRPKKFFEPKIKELLGEAIGLLEKASQTTQISRADLRLTTPEMELSYIYFQWARALALNREYAKAWEKVKLSRAIAGDKAVDNSFVTQLSRLMPEPKN